MRAKPLMRVLPPVGGVIPYRAVLGGLRDSLVGAIEGRPERPGLRQQFIARTGLKHWVLASSGRSALSVVLMALRDRYPDRDEVIIPAYTSYSVPAAVVRGGLRVRLCDVETESLGLSAKDLEREINPRTLCVIPNHLFGLPCQIEAITSITRERRVPVVEDVAQALGVRSNNQMLGTFGQAGIFSLSRGKILPAAGGGLIGTNDEALAQRCRVILAAEAGERRRMGLLTSIETMCMAIFIRPSLYWMPAALPFLKLGASIYEPRFAIEQMSRFQGALAGRLLPALEQLRHIRHRNALQLRQLLTEICHSQNFRITWPREERTAEGGFLRLPILLRSPELRTLVLRQLEEQGLGASAGYPAALSEIPQLKPHLTNPGDEFPRAMSLSSQLLTLPTHPWVSRCDIQRIVEVFRRCLRQMP